MLSVMFSINYYYDLTWKSDTVRLWIMLSPICMRRFTGNAEFAGVDNAGVVKSAIWVVIVGYFNNRFMDFNGLFVAALMGNLNM